jgi:hypothetical protein
MRQLVKLNCGVNRGEQAAPRGTELDRAAKSSRLFKEVGYNTQLLHQAISEHGAGWVAFLDADKFIDDRSIHYWTCCECAAIGSVRPRHADQLISNIRR